MFPGRRILKPGMKKSTQTILLREALILAAVLLAGYLLVASGPTNFRYPMSPRLEIKSALTSLGKTILWFGYPVLGLIRWGVRRFRNQRR